MKQKLGIIGGLGPASTVDYYMGVIDGYRNITKTNEYPQLVVDSVNMTEFLSYMDQKNYEEVENLIVASARRLQAAGATFGAIASNTPHTVFDKIQKRSPIPLISIVDSTCEYAKAQGLKKVLILGTRFTMKNGLYTNAMKKYGIEAVVPEGEDALAVHNIIFPKLEDGIVDLEDKKKMLQIASRLLKEEKADGVVLGCTEIPLMIKENDLDTCILNTTQIHVDALIRHLIG